MPGNMKAAKQKSYHFNLFCSSTWLSCHEAQETWGPFLESPDN